MRIDPTDPLLFEIAMFERLRPSDWLAAAPGAAAPGVEPWPLERQAVAPEAFDRPPRASAGLRLAVAILAALLAHGAALAGLQWIARREMDRVGAVGIELDAVHVEFVSAAQVAPSRANYDALATDSTSPGEAAAPPPAPTTNAATSVAEPETATPAASPHPILATEDPARITTQADTSPPVTPPANDTVEHPHPPAQVVADANPIPTAATHHVTASLPSANEVAAPPADTRAHTSGAAPAAPSPGAVRAYAKSIIEALSRTAPKPRQTISARGTVKLAFAVALDGQIEMIRIVHSSGKPDIDALAVQSVAAARFPPPPAGMTLAERTYEIPYIFR